MNFSEQLNAFFATPASRTKLVTLRTIWRDWHVREQVITSDEHGVDYQKLIGHLKSTNPALVALVEAITTTTSMNLDAVMRAPMRIPLTRQPITIPL
ncbi:hypothetical protein [Pseudomonas fluorescens]|uniref:hypothetical protein n=1 Tax=Pseudomonas fluorescens TaxID=294 RepID=UPI00125135A4|nr:hypothetical protein [Pseudomonas fluorescens]VVN77122.1 hypothetical protein PS720_00814 [Pseudomonas fluorescens]